jgi:SAM-dependent methyltransferase
MSKKSTPEEVQHSAQYPPVVDVCCGSRSFWFDKKDPRALFLDIRRETHEAKDKTMAKGFQEIVIDPDIQCDFTNLPLPDDSFALVVFDPPHLRYNGASGLTHKKYGTLPENWRSMLRQGFKECFRILKHEGVLIFKWASTEIKVSEVLALTDQKPLFGHKSGKQQNTHWIAFLKQK